MSYRFDQHLLMKVAERQLVPFVGAGVSLGVTRAGS